MKRIVKFFNRFEWWHEQAHDRIAEGLFEALDDKYAFCFEYQGIIEQLVGEED